MTGENAIECAGLCVAVPLAPGDSHAAPAPVLAFPGAASPSQVFKYKNLD